MGRVDKLTLALLCVIQFVRGLSSVQPRVEDAQVPVRRHSKMERGEGEAISRIEMSSPGSEGDLSCPD